MVCVKMMLSLGEWLGKLGFTNLKYWHELQPFTQLYLVLCISLCHSVISQKIQLHRFFTFFYLNINLNYDLMFSYLLMRLTS